MDAELPMKSGRVFQIFLLDDSSETLQNPKKEDTRTDQECQSGQQTQNQNATGSIPVFPQSPADPVAFLSSPQPIDCADQKHYPNDEYIETYQHQSRYPTRVRQMSENWFGKCC